MFLQAECWLTTMPTQWDVLSSTGDTNFDYGQKDCFVSFNRLQSTVIELARDSSVRRVVRTNEITWTNNRILVALWILVAFDQRWEMLKVTILWTWVFNENIKLLATDWGLK